MRCDVARHVPSEGPLADALIAHSVAGEGHEHCITASLSRETFNDEGMAIRDSGFADAIGRGRPGLPAFRRQ
jgi:hypothetical protein